MTVYIVDDEPMAIRYLEILLMKTNLDVKVIGTASNGIKAIPEILRLCPDFVFVDISMPIMDGLKMAEEVLKKNPSQKIFVLTAYKDFEYAKKSVQLGVVDYILKNELSEATLTELLQRNAENMELESRKRHSLLELNLRKFLLSDVEPNENEELFYLDKPLQRYVFLYIISETHIVLKYQEQVHREYIDSFEIEKNIGTSEINCRAFVELAPNEYCGILFINQKVCETEKACKNIAKKILLRFENCKESYICLISSPVNNFSKIHYIYKMFREKRKFLFSNEKKIYLETELIFHTNPEWYDQEEALRKKWEKSFEQGKEQEAEILLKEYLLIIRRGSYVWEYTEKILEICRQIRSFVKEKNLDPQVFIMKEAYNNAKSLETDLLENQSKCLYEFKKREEEGYSKYVILTLEYIHCHYSQDISVENIAASVGISEGHLRRLFKTEMNINVVNYLTDYRINIAKRLMEEGCRNIEMISKKTGFTSIQYFSYVFKKKAGITPRDYLRMVEHGTL